MRTLAVACTLVVLLWSRPLEAETISVYSNDFSTGASSEWSNVLLDTTPTGRPFLGRFLNQDTTRLSLGTNSVICPNGLPGHNSVTVSFDLYIIHSWDGALYGCDEWMLSVDGGPVLLDTSFSNPFHGTAYNPQNYPGSYGGDLYPAHTGAAEVNTLGYWNVHPTDFGDSVYHLAFTFPHAANAVSLSFRANGYTGLTLSGGVMEGLDDESWGIDNVQVAVTVPEPATLALLTLGGLLLARRRRVARVLRMILVAVTLLAGSTNPASADVLNMGGTRNPITGQWTGLASLETVPVGNAGNEGDTRYPDTYYGVPSVGSVGYTYNIGRYEVTAGQYCEFLLIFA